jgi:hypothetical protein
MVPTRSLKFPPSSHIHSVVKWSHCPCPKNNNCENVVRVLRVQMSRIFLYPKKKTYLMWSTSLLINADERLHPELELHHNIHLHLYPISLFFLTKIKCPRPWMNPLRTTTITLTGRMLSKRI